MVHTHLKNESARFQEEFCFVHHHLGPCFLPLHPSASVSFKILYPDHVGGEFGRQTPSLVVLPHARDQTGKENNLCHPRLHSDTALVGHRKGLQITESPESQAHCYRSQGPSESFQCFHGASRLIAINKFLSCANILR